MISHELGRGVPLNPGEQVELYTPLLGPRETEDYFDATMGGAALAAQVEIPFINKAEQPLKLNLFVDGLPDEHGVYTPLDEAWKRYHGVRMTRVLQPRLRIASEDDARRIAEANKFPRRYPPTEDGCMPVGEDWYRQSAPLEVASVILGDTKVIGRSSISPYGKLLEADRQISREQLEVRFAEGPAHPVIKNCGRFVTLTARYAKQPTR